MSTLEPLVDTFGRLHDNLRISVTDRCNIRCFYCMPEESPDFIQRQEILTYEEIERFVRVGVRLGIRKIRLTGGEPLLRRDLPLLVRKLAAVPGITDLALTTNGLLLSDAAGPLFDAGLRRINIHVDTLDEAIELFGSSEFTRSAFGDDVVEHLLHFARTEAAAAARHVTDFERGRFFERG